MTTILLVTGGCRGTGISGAAGSLSFSCPSDPAAVISQAQTITIEFGNVALGQQSVLPIDLSSLNGSEILLTEVEPLQTNPTLAFPLAGGTTVVPAPPILVNASFAPTQVGPQTASWRISFGTGSTLTIVLTGNGFPVSLTVEPDPVNFGNVEIHTSFTERVIVTNSSAQTIQLGLAPPDGGPFTIVPLAEGQLAAGDTLSLSVTYAPLQVESDTSSFLLNGCAGCTSGVTVPLLGNAVLTTLSYPNPLQFGFVSPGSSEQKTLALKNTGTNPVRILSQPTLYAGAYAANPPVYAFVGTSNVSYPFTLAAGNELDLPLMFSPFILGAYLDGKVTVQSDDLNVPTASIGLTGYGGGAKISCQPVSLDLGPVAVGYTGYQPLICLNAGTDVPDHPEASLQFDQSQLTSDNSQFTASLMGNLDGGSAVSLSAGQRVVVQVGFRPLDAGVSSATLSLGSNDVADSPLLIPLTGHGVVPGRCLANVLPAGGLSFGEVPKGASALLQFAVQNPGPNYCIVKNLGLDAGSDPTFFLPGGSVPYALVSFPGDPANTTQLPTELRIPVQYAPIQNESLAAGAVDFQIANAQPTSYSVPLSGSSAPACLTFSPAQVDFGLVSFSTVHQSLCFQPRQAITATNSCSSPVTVSDIGLSANLDSTAQFALSGLPALPTSLNAGDQVSFTTTFTASAPGPKAETVQLTSSEFTTPYSLSLVGDAETTGVRTDSFTVPKRQVDLLIVLDTDDDGYNQFGSEYSTQFTEEIPSLIQAAQAIQLDYRIAVTTSAVCSDGDRGYFLPCPHCTANGTAPIYVTAQSQPSPVQALGDLINTVWSDSTSNPHLCPIAPEYRDEQFFEVPYVAFDPSLIQPPGYNAGFLRSSAALALVTINTDAEDDNTSLDPTAVAGFLEGLKPEDPSLVSWSYVNAGLGSDPTARVSLLATATGGTLIDMTIPGWENQLVSLFTTSLHVGTFFLGAQPDNSTLRVTVAGSLISGIASQNGIYWLYDPTRNAVVFSPDLATRLTPGQVVTITYSLSCP